MAWIELHQSLWTHKKTIMIAAILDIDELYAAAHMSKLWTWALDNAPDGNLTGLPDRVIAFGAGWKDDASVFVQAAIEAGWIDREGDSTTLHDWYDYAGRLLEKKEANKERMRSKRAKNVQRTCNEQTTHVHGLPNHTLPNQTIQKDIDSSSTPTAEIENYFVQKRRKGFSVKPEDLQKIIEIVEYGIPADHVKASIDRIFKEFVPKHPKDRITTFSYCEAGIYQDWHLHQERKGVNPNAPPEGRTGGNSEQSESQSGRSQSYYDQYPGLIQQL
ncbi:hypothetical protein [Ferviditalea candida]|uniref:Uncharacterized protein n=1 Tax=Ferviditalea candida TaxID=3108399 RepID=A0ABU5ZNY7_9BACL|nr:hypothetical protein [Paenibacillaceae bacterium T2]